MKACIGQGLCLWNAKTMETVQEGQSPNLFDYWADTSLPFFLLLKSSFRREPWSSGYGWRLRFKRSWVEIPAPYTGWTFYTLICCKNCFVCLKRPKINEKEAGVGPFLKKRVPCRWRQNYRLPQFFKLKDLPNQRAFRWRHLCRQHEELGPILHKTFWSYRNV